MYSLGTPLTGCLQSYNFLQYPTIFWRSYNILQYPTLFLYFSYVSYIILQFSSTLVLKSFETVFLKYSLYNIPYALHSVFKGVYSPRFSLLLFLFPNYFVYSSFMFLNKISKSLQWFIKEATIFIPDLRKNFPFTRSSNDFKYCSNALQEAGEVPSLNKENYKIILFIILIII